MENLCHSRPLKTQKAKILYNVPKAYRPIALLNTMWKVLAALIADHLMYLTEKFHLLPSHHFRGRPGRTTTDTVLLVSHKIKNVWRQGNVTSILFLDVEGAFLNAIPSRLVHNLRKRHIPRKYTEFIAGMLKGRYTSLKFNDYISENIHIDDGIGQGDPLSMVLYQFYNADLFDIPVMTSEAAIVYVDDALILATAKNFETTHQMLTQMITRDGGVYDWSKTYNFPLEHSKLALIDFAHHSNKIPRPNLDLPSVTLPSSESTKYLGMIIDQHLNWKAQHAHAIEKGSKWAAQVCRIARPSWGITPKYTRRLYIGVALPRILYGVEVWCGPPGNRSSGNNNRGSAKVVRQLMTIQRSGALAITGALRTSPTDTLEACAFLLPVTKMVECWCHRAAVRLATVPPEHPLYKPVSFIKSRYTKRLMELR